MSVGTKTGHGLLPKTNSENSQMDFPLQSCVNERKQGGASQGLHCDTVPPSTAFSRETSKSLALIPTCLLWSEMVRPVWDILAKQQPTFKPPASQIMLLDTGILRWLRSHSAKLNMQLMPASSDVLPVELHNFLEWFKNKNTARCSPRSAISIIYCWSQ